MELIIKVFTTVFILTVSLSMPKEREGSAAWPCNISSNLLLGTDYIGFQNVMHL